MYARTIADIFLILVLYEVNFALVPMTMQPEKNRVEDLLSSIMITGAEVTLTHVAQITKRALLARKSGESVGYGCTNHRFDKWNSCRPWSDNRQLHCKQSPDSTIRISPEQTKKRVQERQAGAICLASET